MEQILEPNEQFVFDRLALSAPIFINSGNYFIKYLYDNSPLYIQAPKCITKQGILKGGKKMYCDFLFTNENATFIRWIEDLENYSQKYIYENRSKWFENDLEMHDIENSFTSPLKVFKSGKYYILRTAIPTRLGKCVLKIYDENEMDIDPQTIQDGTNVISIWEVQGIKCSSKNFQIEIEVKQMLVIKPSKIFEKCLIQTKKPVVAGGSDVSEGDVVVPEIPQSSENIGMQDSLGKIDQEPIMVEKEEPQGIEPAIESSDTIVAINTVQDDTKVEDPTPIQEESTMETEEDDEEDESDDENDGDDSEIDVLEIEEEEPDENPSIAILDKSLEIVDLDNTILENDPEPIELKNRNDAYYEIYMEAKKKAIDARNLAISAFLEAKKIKELHKIQDFMDNLEDPSTIPTTQNF
jgi:hypothetical protein